MYDRLGVLTPAEVGQRNGYRLYRESQLDTARLIAMLRRLDMPLKRVAEVVRAPETERTDLIDSYWSEVESRVAFQRELAAYLQRKVSGESARTAGFVVRERDVKEAWVLSEKRHLVVGELVDWIEETTRRLKTRAADYGGPAGHDYVVYHGEVSEDSDGPVEICIPVDVSETVGNEAEPMGRAIRREPAHRVAYVRLRKAQVQYPQILSAYDAVAH